MTRVAWAAAVLVGLIVVDIAQLVNLPALRAALVTPALLTLPGLALLGAGDLTRGAEFIPRLALRVVVSIAVLPLMWLSLPALSIAITSTSTLVVVNVFVVFATVCRGAFDLHQERRPQV